LPPIPRLFARWGRRGGFQAGDTSNSLIWQVRRQADEGARRSANGRRSWAPGLRRDDKLLARQAPARLLTNDLRLKRPKDAEWFALFLGRNAELIQRLDEIFHERVEVGVRDAHPLVRGLHVLPLVHARTAGRLADLIDQIALESGNIGLREKAVDALVGRDVADEIVDYRCDCAFSAGA